jgi:UDP-glucose 4-epimerase
MTALLVTGGAGYIGSHTSKLLVDAGYSLVVLDNLYSGHRWAVPKAATFIEGNAGDITLVSELIHQHRIQAVIHFAGHIVVPESVADPLKYYGNNTCVSRNLLEACTSSGVDKILFSSTAAVYGIPETTEAAESSPTLPITPYGRSKLMTEAMLADLSAIDKIRYVALRYFNVAGADPDGQIGQATPEATHLLKVACETACGLRDHIDIFGTDYPTPDGSCIRDYIHVMDLANAHLLALQHLLKGGKSEILNCGYGKGYSVREVLETVMAVSGKKIKIREMPRRAGDSPALIANAQRIRKTLNWTPRFNDLAFICKTAYDWEVKWQATLSSATQTQA